MFTTDDERTGRFTFEAEGSIDPNNPYFIGKLSHPSGESGVTIGAGYDMGRRHEAQIKSDLISAGLTADVAAKFAKGAGLTFAKADQFVATNQAALVIRNIQVLRNLFAKTYHSYVATAKSDFKYHASSFKAAMKGYGKRYENATFFDWADLYPSIRVMAIDFTYQGFGKQIPAFGRPMHFCMANNFDWLIDYITSTPGLAKYEKGRHRAAYLRGNKDREVRAYSQCTTN